MVQRTRANMKTFELTSLRLGALYDAGHTALLVGNRGKRCICQQIDEKGDGVYHHSQRKTLKSALWKTGVYHRARLVSTAAIIFLFFFLKKERLMFCLGWVSDRGTSAVIRPLRVPWRFSVRLAPFRLAQCLFCKLPFESWCVFICVPVCYVAPFWAKI